MEEITGRNDENEESGKAGGRWCRVGELGVRADTETRPGTEFIVASLNLSE